MKKRIFALLAALPLFGVQIPQEPEHPCIQTPWFTGPLLAPSPVTVPQGHINYEPYLYATANIGRYESNWHRHKRKTLWNFYTQQLLQVGINSWSDFQITPTLYYNYSQGAAEWEIGDLPLGFDFQLYANDPSLEKWRTVLGFTVKETFPIGKYNNLNPNKLGTDIGGEGSWQTTLILNWGNLFYIGHDRFITWRNSLQYTLPSSVQVKNLNVYGGGQGTRGTITPGQYITFDTAIEYTLTRNWVFAIDAVGTWTDKTNFKGTTRAPHTLRESWQFSLAPAMEYNWSSSIGIIAGSWFTIAGKNTIQFVSGIFAFNYYH
jgi:hypothetical protein